MIEASIPKQELAEIVALSKDFGTIADVFEAKKIIDEYNKQGYCKDDAFLNNFCMAATIYRVGFIMGQRYERERKKAVSHE